ncbi:putative permease [Rubidibacter lacunae KORDI 51-2]|uniref:Putative permease n=1 Tax=Rubidibacter lacunae KORDI 51-2 TaxID=582515 RepID=U5DK10_9CHRO|nr:AEC family transporter [Rubidibacter lacunae]ERN42021.1 putative permease [Rubidibacter lacunae KORDI 51-2]
MSVFLPALVPVVFIVLMGIVAQRFLKLDGTTLSQLSVYVLIPALIGDRIYRAELPATSAAGLVAGFVLTCVAMYGLALAIARLRNMPPSKQASLSATTVFGNVGNMGLPINAFAFGEAGLERAAICLMASAILFFTVGPAIYQGRGVGAGLRLILRLPLLYATLAGLSLRWMGVSMPWRLGEGIRSLGDASIPIALLILGMQLAMTPFVLGRYEVSVSLLRLLVGPAIAFGIGRLLRLEGLDLQVLVLQCAMPSAVNTVVWAAEFGGDAGRVARTVVVSTVLALVTLPLVLWLLT